MAAPIIELFSINFKSTFIPWPPLRYSHTQQSTVYTCESSSRPTPYPIVTSPPNSSLPNNLKNAIIALATINAARLIMRYNFFQADNVTQPNRRPAVGLAQLVMYIIIIVILMHKTHQLPLNPPYSWYICWWSTF